MKNIAKLERRLEEFEESEHSRVEMHIQDSCARETLLQNENEELLVELSKRREESLAQAAEMGFRHEQLRVENAVLSTMPTESSRREQNSEYRSRTSDQVAKTSLAERDSAETRNIELKLTIARLRLETRTFWGSWTSLLAMAVIVIVLVETC